MIARSRRSLPLRRSLICRRSEVKAGIFRPPVENSRGARAVPALSALLAGTGLATAQGLEASLPMEHQPRWAEMCARILQQCEALRGGRENLAAFLGVHPHDLGL